MTNSIQPTTLRLVAVALLVAATVLFAIGAAAERSSGTAGAAPAAQTSSESPGHHDADSTGSEGGPAGLDLEATAPVAAAVLVSIAVGAALWFWWRRPLALVLAILFALGFAVLDAREVIHQIGVANPPLAFLAGGVTTLHAAAVGSLVLLVQASATGRSRR